MSVQIKSAAKCPTCGAALHIGAEDHSARCKYCHTLVEISRFTQEEKRLVKAIEEMQESLSEAEKRMEEAAEEFARTGTSAAGMLRQQAEAHYRTMMEALEKKQAAYETAQARKLGGYFRLGEDAQQARRYEEAIGHYQKILAVCEEEAEVHWRVLMCRYGVEYVRDQLTGIYLPTLTRMNVDDILRDADYIAACKYAQDEDVRSYYRREGERLSQILAKYQHISGTTKPYDVFISVKQGDDEGKPTQDSLTGMNLYHQLTAQGLNVFNSRESLKAGEEYEPHIMHALMSAKVLVVVASSEEYLNARWLKNEWRRFAWLKQNEGTGSRRRIIVYSCAQNMLKIPAQIGAVQIIDSVNGAQPTEQLLRAAVQICREEAQNGAQSASAQTRKKKKTEAVKNEVISQNVQTISADTASEDGEFVLDNDGKGDYIIKRYVGNSEYVVIPEEIRGRKVTAIGAGAFSPKGLFASSNLRGVHIPENVTKIKSGAFKNCRELKVITFGEERTAVEGVVKFPKSMLLVGRGALSGTGIRECNFYRGTAFGDQGKEISRFVHSEDGRAKKPSKKMRMQMKPIRTALTVVLFLLTVLCFVLAVIQDEEILSGAIGAAIATLIVFFTI